MKEILYKPGGWFDKYCIKKKFYFSYILCVLLPLIITDSVIIFIVIHSDRTLHHREMENAANAVQYYISNSAEQAAGYAKRIYTNKYVNDFLERQYENTYDYVTSYYDFFKGMWFDGAMGSNYVRTVLYGNNDTLINGGKVSNIDRDAGSLWYQQFKASGMQQMLLFDYHASMTEPNRRMLFLTRLNSYNQTSDNFLLVEFDYAGINRYLKEMNYAMDVFICRDGEVVLSNGRHSSTAKAFEKFTEYDNVGYQSSLRIYGTDLDIYVMNAKNMIAEEIKRQLPVILFLFIVNAILPVIVYRDKIKEQEIIVERQRAELLALRSQINPHFLFNTLESIRMHSVIKKEKQTAEMIEKLAVLQRQYVEWGEDMVKVSKEMEFVQTYLDIQKYRFSDRLSCEIEMDERCSEFRIPKLTIVTFVENACVHGIESKSSAGWIFVRIYLEDMYMHIEIEDTGKGMKKERMESLLWKMRNASIGLLQEKERVGILNACLRLKMKTDDEVMFELDGEEGIGFLTHIKIPCRYLEPEVAQC
ncbi:MAG: histidine kinase [Lachnospiraceae bacterium]